jgi:hypothetical protein
VALLARRKLPNRLSEFQVDLSQDLLELLGGRMTFTTFPEFPIHHVPRTVGAVTTSVTARTWWGSLIPD